MNTLSTRSRRNQVKARVELRSAILRVAAGRVKEAAKLIRDLGDDSLDCHLEDLGIVERELRQEADSPSQS